ncbi:MAG: hypothetical protein IPH16_17840, partial [Haliscomenobacter sp.]|nr:hypothetical protein [Haliscomenobacter sp.]
RRRDEMPVRIHRDQVFELLDGHDINLIEPKIEFIDLVYEEGEVFLGSREQGAGSREAGSREAGKQGAGSREQGAGRTIEVHFGSIEF